MGCARCRPVSPLCVPTGRRCSRRPGKPRAEDATPSSHPGPSTAVWVTARLGHSLPGSQPTWVTARLPPRQPHYWRVRRNLGPGCATAVWGFSCYSGCCRDGPMVRHARSGRNRTVRPRRCRVRAHRPHCPLPGIKGGVCRAGVSFLRGFFWSDSVFRVAWTFSPFLGFCLSSQSWMNWSERSSDSDRMQRKNKPKSWHGQASGHKLGGFQTLPVKGAEAMGVKKKSILASSTEHISSHAWICGYKGNGKLEFCKTPNEENSNGTNNQGKEQLENTVRRPQLRSEWHRWWESRFSVLNAPPQLPVLEAALPGASRGLLLSWVV